MCTLQLFTPAKIEFFAPLRKQELSLVMESIRKAAAAREVVDITEVMAKLVEDMTFKMVVGQAKDQQFDLKALFIVLCP